MHVFPYETKRAHWKMTWWAIKLFQKWSAKLKKPELADMTPARYDILLTLWQRPDWYRRRDDEVYDLKFGELVEKLGLHPSTISKCVKRLRELGFVTRLRDGKGARVTMTKLGLRMLEIAMDILFEPAKGFFAANATFARGHASIPDERLNAGGRDVIDGMLLGFGRRIRQCATELGSRAVQIYDPLFRDPAFVHRFAYAAYQQRQLSALHGTP